MSKASVGDVYAKVIGDVCEASRQDFEEGGVELATLDLLKSEWQKKLSALNVAQLPWGPAPAPAFKEQPTVPSNVKAPIQTLPSNGTKHESSTPPPPQPMPSAPPVKSEKNAAPSQPIVQPQLVPQPYQAPPGQAMTAKERAAMHLQQSYGQRAGAQISQLQSHASSRVPPPATTHTGEYIKSENLNTGYPDMQDYNQDVKPQRQALDQTDGVGEPRDDWTTEYERRKALAAVHGADGDRLIRAQFQAQQRALEGGGLLTTLEERPSISGSAMRAVRNGGEGSSSTQVPSPLARAQGDAAGDDDEVEDEDAINSDLDDPDDLAANAENEETTEQVMLCTYDKVQRVKNKWKCTLKDGILKVGGTEYVFHKGQGEFEW